MSNSLDKCLGNFNINEAYIDSKIQNFSPCHNDHPKIAHYVLYVLKVTPLENKSCIHTMLGNFENNDGKASGLHENGTSLTADFENGKYRF